MSSHFMPLGFHTELAAGAVLSLRSVVDRACIFDRLVVGVGAGLMVVDVTWGPEATGEYVDGWAQSRANPQRVFIGETPAEMFGPQFTGPEHEEGSVLGTLYAFRALPEHVRRIERLESVRITVRNTADSPREFRAAALVEALGAMVRRSHEKRRAVGHPSASGRSHEAPASSVSSSEGSPSSESAAAGISTAADAAAWDAAHGLDPRELIYWPAGKVCGPCGATLLNGAWMHESAGACRGEDVDGCPMRAREARLAAYPVGVVDRDELRKHLASVRGPAPRPRPEWYTAQDWERASDTQRVEMLRRALEQISVLLMQGDDDAEANDNAAELAYDAAIVVGQGGELPGDENSDGTPVDVQWGPR